MERFELAKLVQWAGKLCTPKLAGFSSAYKLCFRGAPTSGITPRHVNGEAETSKT